MSTDKQRIINLKPGLRLNLL